MSERLSFLDAVNSQCTARELLFMLTALPHSCHNLYKCINPFRHNNIHRQSWRTVIVCSVYSDSHIFGLYNTELSLNIAL